MDKPSDFEETVLWIELLGLQALADADESKAYVAANLQQDNPDYYELSEWAANVIFANTLAHAINTALESDEHKERIETALQSETATPLTIATMITQDICQSVKNKFGTEDVVDEAMTLIADEGITPYQQAVVDGLDRAGQHYDEHVSNLEGILGAAMEYTRDLEKEKKRQMIFSVVPGPK